MNDPELSEEKISRSVRDTGPDDFVPASTPVGAEAIEASPRLAIIIVAGTATDHVDVAAASRRGIFVANCPGRNSTAVAELAWGLILACDRRIAEQTSELHLGRWDQRRFAAASGLHGRTLGVVGLGQVGQEVARIGTAFGMDVIAWSRNLTEEKALEHGCEQVVVTTDYRFAQAVRSHFGDGADVIVDGLGDAAREENFAALAPCGHWISLGQASGPLQPISPGLLTRKSATLSCPVVFDYVATPEALTERAQRLWAALADGSIAIPPIERWSLDAAARAHERVESRATIGAMVLTA
jgi:hypothetical protein